MAQPMVGEMSRSSEQTDGMDSEKAADVPSQGARGTVSIQADPDPNERPPTVVDRYFSKHYRIDIQKKECEDICILTHSNKICIVTLAPSHPVLAEKKTVTNVSFCVGGADRLDNKMSGKSKRGAQWLGALSPLCCLTCSDDRKYTVYCGVKGQLIEANSALVQSPQLVTEKPWGTGFLGIMLPALKGYEAEMARLLTEQQYLDAVQARLARHQTHT